MEYLLPQDVRSIINYLLQYTEVPQWGIPSYSRPQPVTNNHVRRFDPIDWSHPPPSWEVPLCSTYIALCKRALQIERRAAATGARIRVHGLSRPCVTCVIIVDLRFPGEGYMFILNMRESRPLFSGNPSLLVDDS